MTPGQSSPSIEGDLAEVFRGEASEHLATLRSGLELLTGADDPDAGWADIRGAAHTLKGAAGVVGLDEVRDLAAELEALSRAEPTGPGAVADAERLVGELRALLGADSGADPGPGSTDTGSTDTGSTDTGSTDTGSTDTGSTDTGSTDTGSTDTGSPEPAEVGSGGPRVRVLVADDSPTFRVALQALLESDPGMETVGSTPDAAAAAELVALNRPDVVLLDVHMPDAGGEWVLNEINKSSPGTRVIVISGDDAPHTRRKMLDAGAVAFIRKGTSSADLLAAIREHAPALPANFDI